MTNSSTAKNLKLAVLVSGRGTNLQAILDAQKSGAIQSQVVAVLSNKSDALALERARSAGIPTQVILSKGKAQDVYFQELLTALDAIQPDFIVLAGYMRILSPVVIKRFENRIINIHPSLLPSFPGLNAQEQALQAGVKVTGCTVHFVDEGCDTGPILVQKTEDILDDDTAETLSARLLKKEHAALLEALTLLENNKVILQGRKTLLRKTI